MTAENQADVFFAAQEALESMFDSDACDSVWGLTPAALNMLNKVFAKYGYKIERMKR